MYRFFDHITAPILDFFSPKSIVEIGVDNGFQTALVAPWCASHGAVLHCVDPQPKFETEEWARRWPGAIEFHHGLSLEVLPRLGHVDVALIDGDHNWYTVFHELKILQGSATREGKLFPLTLLHDVDWPYGRRDLYYAPETIPQEYRNAHRKGGIPLEQRELTPTGFNDHLENAVVDNTPRNGVRTAVEDFITESEWDLTFVSTAGIHGLGVLFDARVGSDAADLIRDRVLGAEGLMRSLRAVELDRLTTLDRLSRATSERASYRDAAREAGAKVKSLEIELRDLRTDVQRVNDEVRQLERDLTSIREKLRSERATSSRLRRQLTDLRRRRSVRVAYKFSVLARRIRSRLQN